MKAKKICRIAGFTVLALVAVLLLLSLFGTVVHGAGLVDDTINEANAYSKYALENYQLDFYVDSSWDWLPWNWVDGIGKGIQYALYAITNFIWAVSCLISNATGYIVQEAYRLDFISDMASQIGTNIQTLAGITKAGFSSEGFYVGFLLILVLVLGIYVTYVGLLKRETTKAVSAIINFLAVFLLSASFIAYAPDYIGKINEFSADVSNSALTLGTKIVMPDSQSKGKDSVDLIRDSLFSIQVQQPWLLLQYGESDMDTLGAERVESLLSASPDTDEREDAVKAEIEDHDNDYLTIPKTMSRMGTVVFLFLFNIGISVFVFLLTGMMLFSQVLFIIFSMFLPVSFLLSMIPTFEGMSKKALTKLFNTIMTRAGLTLVITTAFSISTMFYSISSGYPFFLVAFLQIVTFAGIWFKLGEIMGMFSLQASDSQQLGRRVFRKPAMMMRHRARRMERRIGRSIRSGTSAIATGATSGAVAGSLRNRKRHPAQETQRPPHQQDKSQTGGTGFGTRAGAKVGAVLDTKNRMKDKAKDVKSQVMDMPTQAQYAVHSGVQQVKKSTADFKRGIVSEQAGRQQARAEKSSQRRQSVAEKRKALEKARMDKHGAGSVNGTGEPVKRTAPAKHERPAYTKATKTREPVTRANGEPVSESKTRMTGHSTGKATATPTAKPRKNQQTADTKPTSKTKDTRATKASPKKGHKK